MRPSLSALVATALLAAAPLAFGRQEIACPPERVLRVDPIELVAGREVPGLPELALAREGIEYRFATVANKAAFERAPERYEVADGGACGRMGPLSGRGDARRYAVHAGRLYFFASDGCRAGFLKDPARCIEADDPAPRGDAEQAARGRALLDRVVAWSGGTERWKALKGYRQTVAYTETSRGTDYAVEKLLALRFPDCALEREAWNESWYATIRTREGTAMAARDRHEVVGSSRRRAFDRHLARALPVLLKAHVDPAAGAAPGLIALSDGEGKVGDVSVEFVRVWLHGAASRLAVETATGRPVQLSFRGRDTTPSVGECVRTYTAYATVQGVQLPTAHSVVFEGKPLKAAGLRLDRFEIDPELPDALFVVNR